MILGSDKKRLSKRHGAAGIEDFKKEVKDTTTVVDNLTKSIKKI